MAAVEAGASFMGMGDQVMKEQERMMKDQERMMQMLNSNGHLPMEDYSSFYPRADILSTPKEYIYYIDVPGLSKTDIQVQLEEETTLVVKSNCCKRKREEEGCKYLKLERRANHKINRKFRVPEDVDVSAISAKCENGVLTVTFQKLEPVKPKTVEIVIA